MAKADYIRCDKCDDKIVYDAETQYSLRWTSSASRTFQLIASHARAILRSGTHTSAAARNGCASNLRR